MNRQGRIFPITLIFIASIGLSIGCNEGSLQVSAPAVGVPTGNDEAVESVDEVVEPMLEFECEADAEAPGAPMRRLSQVQLTNTVDDLLRAAMNDDALADSVLQQVRPALEAFPTDQKVRPEGERRGGFSRLDHRVQQNHIDAGIEVAEQLGYAMTDTPEELEALMGDCATDDDAANDAACLEDFIVRFGRLAHRRPLSPDDVDFYLSIHESDALDPAQVGAIVGVMVASPHSVYHVEQAPADAAIAAGDSYALSAHELANRLSYLFWQTMPDAELRALADDGSLLDEEVYRAQVERVFHDPRTDATIRTFFAEWLRLEELEDPVESVDSPIYQHFAGEDLPDDRFLEEVQAEIEQMGSWHTLESGSNFQEMFRSNHSFATEPALASIYGVEPWDGVSPPPLLPADERHGLITRVAFLMDRWLLTRPVVKGLFIREALLCTVLPPPDEEDAAMGFELSPEMTSREQLEEVTEQEGTACAGCHVNYINPLGFATEGYDTLGRVRAEEKLYDPFEEEFVGTRPVDTTSVPQVTPGEQAASQGPGDLSNLLLESGQMEACFARQYLRFAMGRFEHRQKDGCTLSDLYDRLLDGAPLAEVMMSVALRPEFRTRTIPATTEGEDR